MSTTPDLDTSWYVEHGYPVPHPKIADRFIATCAACGARFEVVTETSSGPPSVAVEECDKCGAYHEWRVEWWYHVELRELVAPVVPVVP